LDLAKTYASAENGVVGQYTPEPEMDWFEAPEYWLSRFVFERALGVIYLVAFLNAVNQFRPLLGERGLLPVPRFVRRARFRDAPSLFHFRYSDGLLAAVAWAGVLLAACVIVGLPQAAPLWVSMLVWLALWALYLSIVNVGQTFYSFGWESLLCEVGALAVFLGDARTAPPVLVVFLMRWLLFRLEFGAGLIKLRGDPCWRDLTCLHYHHETQPMPNPLSWFFHHLPGRAHKVEVLANHFAQLVVPFFLFAPQPVAGIAGGIIVLTQTWLILSGNFSWLNFITIVLAIFAFSGSTLSYVFSFDEPVLAATAAWYEGLVIALTALVAALSYWPIRNLLSRRQLMNFSFNRLHFVGTYGAFGHITKTRYEIILEGTDNAGSSEAWKAYEFKGKPGDPKRMPPQVAPYHLRLDWLMWFAAMGPPERHPWVFELAVRLLQGDRATLKLLRRNPFPDRPPALVRARLFRYRFTTRDERRETGAWWSRTPVAEYLPPLGLDQTGELVARGPRTRSPSL
jgi:Lipase maturation factor